MGVKAQTKTSRQKQKLHGTNENSHGTNINSHGTNKNITAQTKTLTAQTKTSRHKHKLSRHKQKHHGTNENSHGTNKNFTAQTKTLTAEVIFAAEIKILYLHTSGYSVARKYGGICGTLSWEKKTRIAKKAFFGIIFLEALSTKKLSCFY